MRIRTRRLQLPGLPNPQCRMHLHSRRLSLGHKLQRMLSQRQKTLIPRIPTRIRTKDIKEMARTCMIRIILPMLMPLLPPNKSLRAPESRKMGKYFSVCYVVQSWFFPLFLPLLFYTVAWKTGRMVYWSKWVSRFGTRKSPSYGYSHSGAFALTSTRAALAYRVLVLVAAQDTFPFNELDHPILWGGRHYLSVWRGERDER
jgi:hypothetical protein